MSYLRAGYPYVVPAEPLKQGVGSAHLTRSYLKCLYMYNSLMRISYTDKAPDWRKKMNGKPNLILKSLEFDHMAQCIRVTNVPEQRDVPTPTLYTRAQMDALMVQRYPGLMCTRAMVFQTI